MKPQALIHLGSDDIIVMADDKRTLERKRLEQRLPAVLRTIYDSGVREVWVIEGPGSFFNIRVGSLLLNTLQSLTIEAITFHTIHKENLHQWLYDQGHTPRHTVVFIGQRKNARWYDHQHHSHEVCKFADIPSKKTPYMVDETAQVFVPGPQITYTRDESPHIMRSNHDIDITGAPRVQSEIVTPHYGMKPLTQ